MADISTLFAEDAAKTQGASTKAQCADVSRLSSVALGPYGFTGSLPWAKSASDGLQAMDIVTLWTSFFRSPQMRPYQRPMPKSPKVNAQRPRLLFGRCSA